eukprot:3699038-Pyramimonas_sp.AAC.1
MAAHVCGATRRTGTPCSHCCTSTSSQGGQMICIWSTGGAGRMGIATLVVGERVAVAFVRG